MPKSLAQLIRDRGDSLTESPIISLSAERFAWAGITPVAMVAFQKSSTFACTFRTVTVPTAHPWTLTELILGVLVRESWRAGMPVMAC
jgi:hypothetical protein